MTLCLPVLRGAACVHNPRIFDGETLEDVVAALNVCACCPVLTECRAWVDGHHKKLSGVFGGRVCGASRRFLGDRRFRRVPS